MKLQKFHGFTALSVYYPTENVWQSDFCEPHEWNTEEAMRVDMLIHGLAEDEHEIERFKSWQCQDEIEFYEKYDDYNYSIRATDYNEYDPTR